METGWAHGGYSRFSVWQPALLKLHHLKGFNETARECAGLATKWHYIIAQGFSPIGAKISAPRIGSGDCPARATCGTDPEDSTGALRVAGQKIAVAIYAEAALATELYRRAGPVTPLNFRGGFRALAHRDSRRYRSGTSYLNAYG